MRTTTVMLGLALVGCRGRGPTDPPTPPPPGPAGLVINEVMSANDAALRDPANPECPEFDDWIELVNDSDTAVSLAGVVLADTSDELALPDQELGPHEHLLVWADDQPEQGPLHAPFKVSAAGERLELRRGIEVLDAVDVPAVTRDLSWARVRDGSPDWAEAITPTPGRPNHRVLPDDPCFVVEGFDDHSYPCLSSEASYLALAGERTELKVVKFDIFDFDRPETRRIAFVDSEFYTLHDQYYLFTVMNGEVFQNLTLYPPYAGDFSTWGQLDAWARSVDLGAQFDANQIRFAGDRLYSPYFYASINGTNRRLGVGTVVHRPATTTREAFWGFELEYGDAITYEQLVVYFEMLAAGGPAELDSIRWLVRSPEQEALARWMEDEDQPYADRIVRYAELTEPGVVEVYNPGVTAGRVLRVRAGESGLDDARDTDILLLEEIPDFLPPCGALITSVPQTPLSHVSLLARSRGIPNLHVAGITTDAEWDAWARVFTRVALEANADGTVRATALTFDEYLRWRQLQVANVPSITPVDPSTLPYAVDLATAGPMLELRTIVGGKAAGMRHLLEIPRSTHPTPRWACRCGATTSTSHSSRGSRSSSQPRPSATRPAPASASWCSRGARRTTVATRSQRTRQRRTPSWTPVPRA
ncbi:MAG: lamin tail domain-containing protein [Alphaproteobacteria bacterium]|nr:lamin tail domain-containing protein [Alphaproteobacteria bacterium]